MAGRIERFQTRFSRRHPVWPTFGDRRMITAAANNFATHFGAEEAR